jgi:hypothetical protein
MYGEPTFTSRIKTISTITFLCNAHAEKHGWDMESKNNRYYWKNQVWWPEMVRFIMNCTIRDDDIHKWSKFDQCDAGLDAFNERVERWKDPVPIVKKYLVDYLAVERLV